MLMVSKDDVFKSLEYNRELIFFNFLNSLENIKRFSFFYSHVLFNFFCEFKKLDRKFAFIFHPKNFFKSRRIYFFQDFFLQFNLKMHGSTFLFNAVLDNFFNSMFSKFLKGDEVSKPLPFLDFKDFSLDKEILSSNSKNFFFLNMITNSNFIFFKKIQTSFFSLTKHKQFILNDSFIFNKIPFFKKRQLKALKKYRFVLKKNPFKKSKVFLKEKLSQYFKKYGRNSAYEFFEENWNKKEFQEFLEFHEFLIERSIQEEKNFFLNGLKPGGFSSTNTIPGYLSWFRLKKNCRKIFIPSSRFRRLEKKNSFMQLNKLRCLKRLSFLKKFNLFKLERVGDADIRLNKLFEKVDVLDLDKLLFKLKASYAEFKCVDYSDVDLKKFFDIMEYLFNNKLLRRCKRFLVKLKKLKRFKINDDLVLKEFESELLKFGNFEFRLYHARIRLSREKIACFKFVKPFSIPKFS